MSQTQDAKVKVSLRGGKKAPKRKDSKKVVHQPVQRILVEDLRHGDKLATSLMEHPKGGYLIAQATKTVEQIEECPSKWRTHIHVNKNMCYDMRGYVHVVA